MRRGSSSSTETSDPANLPGLRASIASRSIGRFRLSVQMRPFRISEVDLDSECREVRVEGELDLSDAAQFAGLRTLGELTEGAWQRDIQGDGRGPGHIPSTNSSATSKSSTSATGAPFYTLRPLGRQAISSPAAFIQPTRP